MWKICFKQRKLWIRKYLKLQHLIINAVRYHNKYKISDKIEGKELVYCKLIRDADKIDILNCYYGNIQKCVGEIINADRYCTINGIGVDKITSILNTPSTSKKLTTFVPLCLKDILFTFLSPYISST